MKIKDIKNMNNEQLKKEFRLAFFDNQKQLKISGVIMVAGIMLTFTVIGAIIGIPLMLIGIIYYFTNKQKKYLNQLQKELKKREIRWELKNKSLFSRSFQIEYIE